MRLAVRSLACFGVRLAKDVYDLNSLWTAGVDPPVEVHVLCRSVTWAKLCIDLCGASRDALQVPV